MDFSFREQVSELKLDKAWPRKMAPKYIIFYKFLIEKNIKKWKIVNICTKNLKLDPKWISGIDNEVN